MHIRKGEGTQDINCQLTAKLTQKIPFQVRIRNIVNL